MPRPKKNPDAQLTGIALTEATLKAASAKVLKAPTSANIVALTDAARAHQRAYITQFVAGGDAPGAPASDKK